MGRLSTYKKIASLTLDPEVIQILVSLLIKSREEQKESDSEKRNVMPAYNYFHQQQEPAEGNVTGYQKQNFYNYMDDVNPFAFPKDTNQSNPPKIRSCPVCGTDNNIGNYTCCNCDAPFGFDNPYKDDSDGEYEEEDEYDQEEEY